MLRNVVGADEIFSPTQIRVLVMKALYLLINFFTIIVPFVFSFHPRIRFNRTWFAYIPACLIVAAFFIVWDSYFVTKNVWSFNPDYITGIHFFGLPVEEIVFFICIPYACVFTYHCLTSFMKLNWTERTEFVFCIVLSLFLFATTIIYHDRMYTFVTCLLTGLFCLFLKFVAKVNWFGKAVSVYALLLIPFLIVNGILTGTGPDQPVVIYNNDENMGIRILTIPEEDVFYGFLLFLMNLYFYHLFLKRGGKLLPDK